MRTISSEKKTPEPVLLPEIEARLFQEGVSGDRSGGFPAVRRQNSALHWAVASREAEILRAAGFSG